MTLLKCLPPLSTALGCVPGTDAIYSPDAINVLFDTFVKPRAGYQLTACDSPGNVVGYSLTDKHAQLSLSGVYACVRVCAASKKKSLGIYL